MQAVGVRVVNSIGIELIEIPAGKFRMGLSKRELFEERIFRFINSIVRWLWQFWAKTPDSEKRVVRPVHLPCEVTLTRPFRLGRTVVTQGQWKQVMGTEPWVPPRLRAPREIQVPREDVFEFLLEDSTPGDIADQLQQGPYFGRQYTQAGEDYPATFVSWEDAVKFCKKLTDLERKAGNIRPDEGYRLPTEAEWEYACRAGTKTTYSFGNNESKIGEYAWWGGFDVHSLGGGEVKAGAGNAKEEQYAHKVGLKKPNPWGLYDMHGNVSEWCSDWYGPLMGGEDPLGHCGVTKVDPSLDDSDDSFILGEGPVGPECFTTADSSMDDSALSVSDTSWVGKDDWSFLLRIDQDPAVPECLVAVDPSIDDDLSLSLVLDDPGLNVDNTTCFPDPEISLSGDDSSSFGLSMNKCGSLDNGDFCLMNEEDVSDDSDRLIEFESSSSHPGLRHVIRGGCWRFNPFFCASAFRDSNPSWACNYLGFRVALVSLGDRAWYK